MKLPDSAYEKAVRRYEDIGEWFSREESRLKNYTPHVFPQGSFKLGTAIKPLNGYEEYDLDISCKLNTGISKATHTQEDLKNLIGYELKLYRKARGIETELESKHRCWRIEYKDQMSFHIDIVPCIPDNNEQIIGDTLRKMYGSGSFSDQLLATTVAITDDRSRNFRSISHDWKISNPEGYSLWFESCMSEGRERTLLGRTRIDDIPLFKRKKAFTTSSTNFKAS